MRLVVARHGATQHNLAGQITGQLDAPLSRLGERQAQALAQRLATWRFDEIVASDLARARVTAEGVAARHSMPVRLDPDLREIDMGLLSGRSFSEWSDEERARFAQMQRDASGLIAAPGGESFADLAARVVRALERTRARQAYGSVLWVTHGGVISALLVSTLGIGFDRRGQFQRANCSLFELHYEDCDGLEGQRVVIARMNDTSHLETIEAQEQGEMRQAL